MEHNLKSLLFKFIAFFITHQSYVLSGTTNACGSAFELYLALKSSFDLEFFCNWVLFVDRYAD